MLPDFVIIGTQRGGTTSLYNYLTSASDVHAAARKEIHFFDRNRRHGVGHASPSALRFYRANFPLASGGRPRAWRTGEATPILLFDPRAPGRVASVLPDGRFPVLVRDPVERAYSQWKHNRRAGRESLSFEAAVEREVVMRNEGRGVVAQIRELTREQRDYSYVARGEYVDQLERWIARVGRDQLLVVQSERFFREPGAVVGEVREWLHLPRATRLATFAPLNASDASPVPDAVRRSLSAHFAPFNERLFALLDTSYDWT